MNRRRAVLLTTSEVTRDALVHQLNNYLGDDIEVIGYAVEQGLENILKADLYIFSSALQYRELLEVGYSFEDKKTIVGKRTVNTDHLDQIVELPENSKVLFVNDSEESTIESIEILNELGVNHIEYIPYFPGSETENTNVQICITPGAAEIVPQSIERIIDIGTRIFDFTTIAKILGTFDLIDDKGGMFSRKYLQNIIGIAQKLSVSKNRASELQENFKNVIEGLEEGLLAYDSQGKITVFNDKLKRILKLKSSGTVGLKLNQVISNQKLITYLMDSENKENKIMTFEGEEVMIHKTKAAWKGVTIASFTVSHPNSAVNGVKRKKIVNSGYIAKYTMDDIAGQSSPIKASKLIAEKLARTDMTILIEGESGTGKEMFASAIHNTSERKYAPFLAINFSALPEDLVESELFGYEEGAFTGAKKGGKEGFFEQADGGTIFLDEIGDVSLKVQARLLRVLEEKEVMRIGGNKIHPVNVRVIAATNKDLSKMVEEKTFREDLYYRLKMGYITLPPLRQRRDDIPLLLDHLLSVSTIEEVQISDAVYSELRKYDWLGNVREMRNTVTYMLAVKSSNTITLEDLPQRSFFKESSHVDSHGDFANTALNQILDMDSEKTSPQLNRFDEFILNALYEQPGIGRKLLSEKSYESGLGMTENQIRGKLNRLEDKGLIEKRKGRFGTSLTNRGEEYIKK